MRERAALGALLALGIALRGVLSALYSPAVLDNPDSGRYLRSAFGPEGLFADPFAPGGYPLFLRAGRALSGELWVTIALQHALGVLTALLLYGCVRRAGGRWLALVPAAVVLLSGDQLYLEHALLSESLFTVLVAGAAYAGVRALEGRSRRLHWLALCGGLLGAGALTRGVGLALVPVAVGGAALAARPGTARRLGAAGAVLCAAALPLTIYAGAAASQGGSSGLVEQSGWSLYARAAPFARCTEFRPPRGTEALCETSPAGARPGGSFYLWDRRRSPARRAFGFPPAGNDRAGAFARAAIAAQPVDYLREVGSDLRRVARPDAPARALSGGGSASMGLDRRSPGFEAEIVRAANAHYAPLSIAVSPRVALAAAYQRATSAATQVMIVMFATILLVLLAVQSVGRQWHRGERGLLLLAALALTLVVAPVAVFQYTPRFALPALGLWSAAGAAALASLGSRLAARRVERRRRAPAGVRGTRARVASTP